MSRSLLVLGLALVACGPSGTLTGKVTVEGGSAANLAVLIYGPTSTAVVTKDDGSFTATSMQDGAYVVRVVVKGAEVEDQSVPGTVKSGKTDVAPNLDFKIPAGKVSGKVTFTDGSDSSGLAVTLTGATSLGTTTGAGGAFSFTSVPAGAYLATVGAPNTREGQVSVGVTVAGMASDVGELFLTPVGRIGGIVTANSTPVAGAIVNVAGTQLTATTDALGAFSFAAVPAGAQTFVARATLPVPRIASQLVTVTRGPNMDLAISLMDETHTGTVTGNVTFVGVQSPTIISVTVPGTNTTATPGPDGSFTLTVPVGSWDVVATAPSFPRQLLGHVEVTQGNSQTLPGATLSLYEPVWTSQSALNSAQMLVAPAGPWVAFQVNDLAQRILLFNRTTRDARVVVTGGVSNPQLSRTGKFFGYVSNNQLFTYETATGAMKTWGVGTNLGVTNYGFSNDETVLFIVRTNSLAGAGVYFERIVLSTGVVTRYPTSGLAQQVARQSNDRYFVQEASGDVTLVQPTNDFPQILTQTISGFGGPGLQVVSGASVMSTTGCTSPSQCSLKVISPTATTAAAVAGVYPSTVSYYQNFFLFPNQPAEWPGLYNPSNSTFSLIRAADGTAFVMTGAGTTVNSLSFSPGGLRYALTSSSPGNPVSLREEALPPTNPAPVAQMPGGSSPAYISPTRLIWFDTAARRVIDVKSGVATIDTDVHPTNSMSLNSSMAVWSSATKWKAVVGDSAAVGLDAVPLTQTAVSNFGARGTTTPVPTVGYASFDNVTTWVVDGAAGSARRSTAGFYGGTADRWGSTEIWRDSHPGVFVSFVTAGATEQIIDIENVQGGASLNVSGGGDLLVSAVSGKQLLLGWNR